MEKGIASRVFALPLSHVVDAVVDDDVEVVFRGVFAHFGGCQVFQGHRALVEGVLELVIEAAA